MKSVSIADAKTRLSELIDLMGADEYIVITRHGQPVARLMPMSRNKLHDHSITAPQPLARDTIPADLDLPDEPPPPRR